MAFDAGGELRLPSSSVDFETALSAVTHFTQLEAKAEEEAQEIRIRNIQELYNLRLEFAGKALKDEQKIRFEAEKEFFKFRDKAVKAEIKKQEKAKNGKLTIDEKKAIELKYAYDDKVRTRFEDKFRREQERKDKARIKAETDEYIKQQQNLIFGSGTALKNRFGAFKDLMHYGTPDGSFIGYKNAGLIGAKMLSNVTKSLDAQIDAIASNKAFFDTRLQGSHNSRDFSGSYWNAISDKAVEAAGISPYTTQEKFISSMKELVGQGISYNVEQRAFLQTISDKIANTFNAADGTLLRLVRIQHKDSTASRLGLEASMNAFLNNMYETSEYMGGIMAGVRGSLEEAMSLMGSKAAVDFEASTQKWLGSLYSVGMSQQGVSSIAGALGKLGAGDIDGLFGSGAGNLLVMAANNAGKSVSDILAEGLTGNSANSLLNSAVNYLGEMYDSAGGNKVIQQQIASIYGLSASDLKAAASLSNRTRTISNTSFDYNNKLYEMMGSMGSRMSLGEMLSNSFGNFKYTMASGIASNPILYMTNKLAGLLETVTGGGMAIPAVGVLGNIVDLETNIADLMRAGAMGGSVISAMAKLIGSSGGFNVGRAFDNLKEVYGFDMGISSNTGGFGGGSSFGGGGGGMRSRGAEKSNAGYVGNSSGSDVKNATLSNAYSDTDQQVIEAQESEENSVTIKTVDGHLLDIYDLLKEVVDGSASLSVRMDLKPTGTGWN